MTDLQYNRVSSLEPSGSEASTLPLGHRGLCENEENTKLIETSSRRKIEICKKFHVMERCVETNYIFKLYSRWLQMHDLRKNRKNATDENGRRISSGLETLYS
ncbi:hypothetical protein AVEN_104355-1 [Araneus ventricosus]|uniref:Uncharacterized protein n=1 Tax=Araneus ventricosus TaxID=182803 RepID=A0A4Y2BVA9_ARAVE|nr:hypothetical protein AVEN_104355-1 [Araneus ventricosus]